MRTSALIVSAGIGLAVLSGWGCGVAAADPTDSTSSSSDSSDSSDSAGSAGTGSAGTGSAETARDESDTTAPDTSDVSGEDAGTEVDRDAGKQDTEDDPRRPPRRKDSSSLQTRSGDDRQRIEPSAAAEPDPRTRVETQSAKPDPAPQIDQEVAAAVQDLPANEVTEVVVAEPGAVDVLPDEARPDTNPAVDPPMHKTADIVTRFLDNVFRPFSAADLPDAPPDNPAEWALMAAARREIGVSSSEQAGVELPVTAVVAEETLPGDWEDQYIGAPSFVHQLVVVGLRVVDVVLKPFGGLLKFTSLEVPLFTDGVPPFFFRHGLNVQRTEFDGMPVWTLQPKNATDKYVVALHGGAYVAEASLFHWWTYTDMARDTGATVVVPLYPLVPDGGTASVAVPKTANLIEQLIAQHGAENVSVIGDSAGGGLALAAVQELVHRDSAVPSRMVLFAPWLDVTVSDPLSAQLDPGDPLLDVPNLQQAGRDWAGDLGVTHPFVSPLYGSLDGLPPTTVYSGSLDLLTPDTLRLQQLVDEGQYTNFTFELRRDLLHDWAIFGFLPDAHAIRPSVYRALLGE